jgi:hypothetical protein
MHCVQINLCVFTFIQLILYDLLDGIFEKQNKSCEQVIDS